MITILQINKLYDPWIGGVETVVKSIVENKESKYKIDVLVANEKILTSARPKILSNGTSICFKTFSLFFFINTPFSISFIWKYNSLKKNYDIIHAHLPNPLFEFAYFLFGHTMSQKLIVTVHADIKKTRFKNISFLFNPLLKKIYNNSQKIVVTAPQNFKYNNLLQPYKNKIAVIPLAGNAPLNASKKIEKEIQDEFKLNIEDFIFIYVGRLAKYKGLNYLINAFQDIDAKLLIIGGGPEKHKIYKKIINLKLENKIFLTGYRSDTWVSSAYNLSKVFVFPSITQAEAFGIVQVEAMMHGLPIINTWLSTGVNFASIDNITGITVSPKNVSQLNKAMKIMMSNKEKYNSFSLNARSRAAIFNLSRMLYKYDMIYKRL